MYHLVHGPMTLKSFFSLTILAALLALPGMARADEIALWNFNGSGFFNNGFDADRGAGKLEPTATFTDIFFTSDGISQNAQMGDVPGRSLLILGGANNMNNGSFVDMRVSTVGFNSIMVSFAANRTAGGFFVFARQFSTDGTNFTPLGLSIVDEVPPNPTPDMAQVYSDSFSGAAANNPLFTYRLIIAGNTNGNMAGIRFDNVLVSGTPTAVPEPATLFLLGTGLFGAVGAARRRRRKS